MKKLLMVLALLGACGGDDDGGDPMPTPTPTPVMCSVQTGTYRLDWTEENGTCGAVDSGLVVIDDESGAGACTVAKSVRSADRCEVSKDLTCPFDVSLPGWTIKSVSAIHWSTAGDSGSGTVNVTVRDDKSALKCMSLYRVTYLRQ